MKPVEEEEEEDIYIYIYISIYAKDFRNCKKKNSNLCFPFKKGSYNWIILHCIDLMG